MNGVIGLNILGDRAFDRAVLISLVERLRPAYCVVLNNPSLAAQLAAYTHPIVRRTPDDSAQDHYDPIDFVRSRAPEIPPNGYLYLGNEPQASKKLNDWTVTALHAAHDLGIRCCILNLATGNPELDAWDSLTECIRLNNAYGGINGVHAYWMNLPLQPPSYPYHTGRFFDAMERFGGRWIVTEAGANKDKGGGIPDGWAGWLTFRNEFDYANDFAAITPLWAGKNVALCTFSYPEWDGHGFDVSHATAQLQPRWIMLNQQYKVKETVPMPTVTPAPDGVRDPFATKTTVMLKLRPTPSTAQPEIRIIPQGVNITVYQQPRIPGGDYLWVYTQDGVGNSGYTAVEYAPGKPSYDPPLPAVVEPPLPPVTHPTPEEVAAALEVLNSAKADNTAVGVGIDNAIALIKGELLPAAPNKVTLDVPFVSQRGSDADISNNDCGAASLLMLTRFAMKSRGFLVPDVPTVDDIIPYTPLGANPAGLLNFTDLTALAKRLGFTAVYKSGLTPDALRRQLDTNTPVMVLLDYSVYYLAGAKIPHLLVVSGYDGDEFITQDPYLRGANVRVSAATLEAAMTTVPMNTGSGQGMVLAA